MNLDDAVPPACKICSCGLYDITRTTCEPCQGWLLDGLNEIEHLWLKLPDYLERGTTGGVSVSGSRAPAMPLNAEVLELTSQGGIVTQLLVHEDDWRKARRFTATPWRGNFDQTLPGVVRFLRTNLAWACQNYEHTDDLAKDLRRLIGRCRAVVTGEPRERRFTVHCAADQCGGAMQITINTRSAECPDCYAEYSHGELMDLKADFRNRAAA